MSKRVSTGKFELELHNNKHELAYLKLPSYPLGGYSKVSRSFRLFDILGEYKGPDVVFDFDPDEILVGIEVITDYFDEEE